MAKKKTFHITRPDLKVRYLGSGHKQKVSYLQLPADFGEQMLTDDIKTGAVIYGAFPETLKLSETRYNVVTAPTEEDGLRAVAYLAGIYAEEEGFDNDDLNDTYEDAQYRKKINFEKDDVEFELEDIDDEDEEYYESFDRIPVIGIHEVMAQEDMRFAGAGFGVFNMEMQSSGNKTKPYWLECTDHSVCIVKNASTEIVFGGCSELLDKSEIRALKRFASNEKVYLLVVSDDIKEDDYSITTAVLDYTANLFRVDQSAKARTAYYEKMLACITKKNGFAFSKGVDVPLLTDRLSKIDEQFPCERFHKIMEYLAHIDAPHTLRNVDFDKLGLSNLISKVREENTAGDLSRELVGMDDVKKQVTGIMNMLRYVKLRTKREIKHAEYHNVHLFIGAPGTAKTSVAKMMCDAMQKEGLIPGNRFISLTGASLKGSFVGQTAPRVHALFESYDAIFIDEAYSLTCGSDTEGGGIDSYSQEALAQLAVELEQHATDKLVIFAGYGGRNVSKKNNLMHKFLTANPGIASRINSTIYFDSYTPADMVQIVHHLAKNASLTMPEDQDEQIARYFATRQKEEDFGNGREARVFVENCERYVAQRVAGMKPEKVTNKMLSTITAADVTQTIKDLKEKRLVEMGEFTRALGFK